MIDFACHCGYAFSVPQDMAGGLIQCPNCRKLNDVPLLSDLEHMETDGIYKLDQAPARADDPGRVARLAKIYTREHHDAAGQLIDNRGSYDVAPDAAADQQRAVPKYDPVTGELIRELDVKPDDRPDPASIPVARMAPVAAPKIVNGMDVPHPLEVLTIPMRLFSPINLFVMGCILLTHVIAQAMAAAIGSVYLVLTPFWFILQALIISHFGNVIDETGPSSRSELPTPLRGVAWEDTGLPFFNIMAALTVCYAPAFFVWVMVRDVPQSIVLSIAAALAAAGTLLFPAAALSCMTSGSVLNLRPDRLVLTALRCGPEYMIALATWVAGAVCYLAGLIAINWIALESITLTLRRTAPPWMRWYLGYGGLILGIWLLHFLAWHLGTLYRRHHEQFPWIYQRHDGAPAPASAAGFAVKRPPRKQNRQSRLPEARQQSLPH